MLHIQIKRIPQVQIKISKTTMSKIFINGAVDCASTKKEESSSNIEDSPLFQIFGINLYFDDILLVCLIFFLYQEGVKDESLFIALILLLLS